MKWELKYSRDSVTDNCFKLEFNIAKFNAKWK